MPTIAIVEIMLSASFCAVPAFSRVEPVSTSGPTSISMAMSAAAPTAEFLLHVTPTVAQPTLFAYSSAAITYGVRPLAAIPTTVSLESALSSFRSSTPMVRLSSAPSTERTSAPMPPAMRPTTISGGVPKVGTHSVASRIPRRPLVPAPR